jgi:aspartyl-tRNA(Asn)/glutamyl-tRNA(Gln) amidotransferase subunit C
LAKIRTLLQSLRKTYMRISNQDIFHIAKLARLKISEQEADGYASSLTEIISLVSEMKEIDTQDIEPMAHPQDVSLRLRDDCVTEVDQRSEFQQVAPQTESGLYLVPKVLE